VERASSLHTPREVEGSSRVVRWGQVPHHRAMVRSGRRRRSWRERRVRDGVVLSRSMRSVVVVVVGGSGEKVVLEEGGGRGKEEEVMVRRTACSLHMTTYLNYYYRHYLLVPLPPCTLTFVLLLRLEY